MEIPVVYYQKRRRDSDRGGTSCCTNIFFASGVLYFLCCFIASLGVVRWALLLGCVKIRYQVDKLAGFHPLLDGLKVKYM